MISIGQQLPAYALTGVGIDSDIQRKISMALRVLDALQTGELCACNWKKGDDTLQAA